LKLIQVQDLNYRPKNGKLFLKKNKQTVHRLTTKAGRNGRPTRPWWTRMDRPTHVVVGPDSIGPLAYLLIG
jgi:hypothetical protein